MDNEKVQEVTVKFSDLLHSANLKPTQLAQMTGISAAMLSQIKNGNRYPSSKNARKIATALGVAPGELWNALYEQ